MGEDTFPSCNAIFLDEQVPSQIFDTVGQLDSPPPVTDARPLPRLPDDALASWVLGAG